MRIEAVDFFYLSMPEVLDIGDGSQDACLVRVRAGGYTGWGECEAPPLVCISGLVCPKSHSAAWPVRDSVLGQPLDDPADIARIATQVGERSLDMLQADHILSGIDVALWDLLGQRLSEPVYRLLGYPRAYPKLPYASVLFGDDAAATLRKAQGIRSAGFRAAKFGWGPYGKDTPSEDAAQVRAAREGLGEEGILLIDGGTVWREDIAAARLRVAALQEGRATWFEEPFVSGALDAYREIAALAAPVKLAGGEGCHTFYMAQHMMDYGGIGYVQIDAGRIGGISVAKRVADYAVRKGVTYVNHTFTSNLALSASLQPFAGIEAAQISEYPTELASLAAELTLERITPDGDGFIHAPAAPGLGMTPNPATIRKYLVEAEIRAKGKLLYRTPQL
jgi:L-alanine-DL-glutamate epimerase-like enolase superfamily enzyme